MQLTTTNLKTDLAFSNNIVVFLSEKIIEY